MRPYTAAMELSPQRLAFVLAGMFCLNGCSGPGREGAMPVPASVGAVGGDAASAPAGERPQSVPAAGADSRRGAATPPPRAETPVDSTAGLRQDIERVIGDAACRDDSQCRVLPLGAKPCGGPEAYLAYSTERTDVRQLKALASRYEEARSIRNQRLGLVSDCSVLPEPAVRCVPVAGQSAGGRCQATVTRGGPLPATR